MGKLWIFYSLILPLLVFEYSNAINFEFGFGQTNLKINGKIGLEQEDLVIKSYGSPSVKHFFINIEFPGTLIPCFKYEYISHTHSGGAGANVYLPLIIEENPLSDLYSPFYGMFEDFTDALNISFYKDIKISGVDVSIKTQAEEHDYIFYYKFYISDYFVPKLGLAIKNLHVKTRYTVKVPLFFFKLTDEVEINKKIPMVFYGFQLYIPVIPKHITTEFDFESKEIYAQRNFMIDLKTVFRVRVLSYRYFKNVFLGIGYRFWKLDATTVTKKTKQKITEKYRWYGLFTEVGMMF